MNGIHLENPEIRQFLIQAITPNGVKGNEVVGLLLRDVVLTRDEVEGLMAGLLTSNGVPTGTTRLGDWHNDNSEVLGQ